MGVQIPCRVHSQMPPEDVVCAVAPPPGGGIPQTGPAEGKHDRRRAFDARSCAHDDIDPTEIRRVTGDRFHQGEKRDTPRTGLWGDPAEFRRTELLGTRVFYIDGWPR